MTDYTPPERIYLQTHEDRIHDTDTEYIRTDLVDSSLAKKSLIADNKRLTEQLEAARRQGAMEMLALIADGEGWEESENHYERLYFSPKND